MEDVMKGYDVVEIMELLCFHEFYGGEASAAIGKELERRTRAAICKVGWETIKIPSSTLKDISEKIFHMAKRVPRGLRGCVLNVYLKTKERKIHLEEILFSENECVYPTNLILELEEVKSVFGERLRRLSRFGEMIIGNYTLEKKRAYGSSS